MWLICLNLMRLSSLVLPFHSNTVFYVYNRNCVLFCLVLNKTNANLIYIMLLVRLSRLHSLVFDLVQWELHHRTSWITQIQEIKQIPFCLRLCWFWRRHNLESRSRWCDPFRGQRSCLEGKEQGSKTEDEKREHTRMDTSSSLSDDDSSSGYKFATERWGIITNERTGKYYCVTLTPRYLGFESLPFFLAPLEAKRQNSTWKWDWIGGSKEKKKRKNHRFPYVVVEERKWLELLEVHEAA